MEHSKRPLIKDIFSADFLRTNFSLDIPSLVRYEVVDDTPSRTLIYGTTVIKGQLFDWGKGKKYLEQLFEHIEQRLQELGKTEVAHR